MDLPGLHHMGRCADHGVGASLDGLAAESALGGVGLMCVFLPPMRRQDDGIDRRIGA